MNETYDHINEKLLELVILTYETIKAVENHKKLHTGSEMYDFLSIDLKTIAECIDTYIKNKE